MWLETVSKYKSKTVVKQIGIAVLRATLVTHHCNTLVRMADTVVIDNSNEMTVENGNRYSEK